MNHDDAFSNSIFDLPDQVTKSTAIEPVTDIEFAIEQVKSPVSTLAATQDYQSRQDSAAPTSLASPTVISDFLPTPNRLFVIGGLAVVSVLGIGAVAANFVTYRTTVTAKAVIEPVDNVQSLQSGRGGVVDSIFVQEHDTLTPGQEIAVLGNPSLHGEVVQIEAQIAGINERMEQIDGQLNALDQRRTVESAWSQQITGTGLSAGGSLQRFEYSKQRLVEYRSELETQLKAERGKLEQTQQQIENLTIRAPKAGNIYDLKINRLGQIVSADETIAKVVSDGVDLEIRTVIPDTQINNVEVGHPTQMTFSKCESFRFGTLPGQVTSVKPILPDTETDLAQSRDFTQKNYIVTVEASEKNLQSGSRTCEVLPGMKGELQVIAKQEKLINFFLRKLRFKTNV